MSLVHVHLILNHVPIVGTVVAGVLFAIAALRRNLQLQRVALAFLLVFALLTIPVYFTGEPAEHAVEHLAGVSEAAIDRHEDAANASFVAVEILGAAALLSLALFRRRALPRVFAAAMMALTLVTAGLFGWTGYLGGEIRHSEITAGSGDPSPLVAEAPRRGRDHHARERERER
jgi:hypothetical protein